MKPTHALLLIFLGTLILPACTNKPQTFGVLEGHVTIGPLSPVVREGDPDPTPNPEVYTTREVVVFNANGKTEFTRIKIDATGNYQAELPLGTYIVDINHSGIDFAKGLPMEIIIQENEVTKLDIDIDTGIR